MIKYFSKLFEKKMSTHKNISVNEFKELMNSADSVILDVRSKAELVEGHIPGHIMIDIYDPVFGQEIEKLDRDKTYLVYCRSGNRSGSACGFMASKGFTNLYNLNGGIMAWNKENH